MSKVVITGGAGFIGSHIAEEIAKEYEVVVIDNLDDYYSPEIKKQNLDLLLKNKNVSFVNGDIRDSTLLKQVIDADVEFVFHEAAQAGVRISVENPFKPNDVNVVGTLNVLQASLDAGVKRVINASSSSVYGKVKYLPFDESHPTQPVSPYGVSKLAAEHYCRVFYEVYGLPTVSLRYFTVYGPRMRPDLAISIFTRKMLANEPITVFGDGEQTRDFTYIDDIVRANCELLRTSAADGYAMNVGGGRKISLNGLITIIGELTNSESTIRYSDKQKGDAEHTLANNSLAGRLIRYKPGVSVEEGIGRYVAWYSRGIEI